MSAPEPLNRLVDVGVAEAAGISAAELAVHCSTLPDEPGRHSQAPNLV